MRYKNCKIYKLVNNTNDMIYIGSTINSLRRRFSYHKYMAKTSNIKLYKAMREIGIDKFRMELLEECSFEYKEDLLMREKDWIMRLDSIKKGYNHFIPTIKI